MTLGGRERSGVRFSAIYDQGIIDIDDTRNFW